MKVFQLSSDVLPVPPRYGGAIETYIWNLSKSLSSHNVDVCILSLDKKSSFFTTQNLTCRTFKLSLFSRIIRIPILKTYRNFFYLLFIFINIFFDLRKKFGSPDIIHSHYPGTAIVPLIIRPFFKKTKFILTVHGEYDQNIFDKFILSKYDKILVVSSHIKKKVIENFKVPSEKVVVVHNGVDTNLFKYDYQGAREIRQKLGFTSNHLILFVGRIVPQKGLIELIESLPDILVSVPDAKLIIVGPIGDFSCKRKDDYFKDLMDKTMQLGLGDSVIYLGQIPLQELVKVYSAANLCVVPSVWDEPFGLVVIEAMACSRPVVAFSVGGIPEIIEDCVSGYLVERGNKKELAHKIVMLLSDPEKGEYMGRMGRNRVERYFSYERIAMKLLSQIYV